MHEPLMPTAISFSLDVPHETSRSLSGSLQARLQPPERSVEELRADSERATERTRQLREAHIESVKERAARESQRCDEVAARKRRMMHEEAQTLVARMGMKDGYYDAFLEDKREKQESEKARRAALAEAASASRLAADQEKAVRGVRMAERVEQAVRRRIPSLPSQRPCFARLPPTALSTEVCCVRYVCARASGGVTVSAAAPLCCGSAATRACVPVPVHTHACTHRRRHTIVRWRRWSNGTVTRCSTFSRSRPLTKSI